MRLRMGDKTFYSFHYIFISSSYEILSCLSRIDTAFPHHNIAINSCNTHTVLLSDTLSPMCQILLITLVLFRFYCIAKLPLLLK